MQCLLKMTGWKESEVLYFGDDVYGDLAVSFTSSLQSSVF